MLRSDVFKGRIPDGVTNKYSNHKRAAHLKATLYDPTMLCGKGQKESMWKIAKSKVTASAAKETPAFDKKRKPLPIKMKGEAFSKTEDAFYDLFFSQDVIRCLIYFDDVQVKLICWRLLCVACCDFDQFT